MESHVIFRILKRYIEPYLTRRSGAWKKLVIAAILGASIGAYVCIKDPTNSVIATCGIMFASTAAGALAGIVLLLYDTCAVIEDSGLETEKGRAGFLRELITAIAVVAGGLIGIALICLLIVTVMDHYHIR
ncbi:MAG TPA: hypothetical protein VG722_12070 [Tepidisphaeraceae bacterium]|nr:hypothetical protein [Tepidisphaeraceae bacterium]